MRAVPDPWIDPLEFKVVGLKDSLTKAALAVRKPKSATGPFAVKNPKPFPGKTRFGGSTPDGISIDGTYIYPPLQLIMPA